MFVVQDKFPCQTEVISSTPNLPSKIKEGRKINIPDNNIMNEDFLLS